MRFEEIHEKLVADAEKVRTHSRFSNVLLELLSLVLKILLSVDVSTKEFRDDMENRFAIVYKEGFKRLEGKSDSILKRKRRKRYTQVGDAAVHVSNIIQAYMYNKNKTDIL